MKLLFKLAKWVVALAIVFVAATIAINAYCILSTRDTLHTIAQIEESGDRADAIVVLGASVYADGTPSDILADRLEVACDLYLSGAAPVIIASGDNRTSHYNETDAMKAYCVKLGVPEEAVMIDRAGYDTYDSMYRAFFIYGAQNVFVVTQAYHLYRALMIGNLLGMQTQGVAADKGTYFNQAQYSFRDVLARDKDFVRAVLKLPPEDASQPIAP